MRNLIRIKPESYYASFHIQIVRSIRNQVKDFMTDNTEYISEEQQEEWFAGLDHDNFKVYLYVINYVSAGYGIVRVEDVAVLLTGAISEEWRSRGFGKDLFTRLIEEARQYDLPIRLDVRLSNIPAVSLYESLGFVEYDKSDTIMRMELI